MDRNWQETSEIYNWSSSQLNILFFNKSSRKALHFASYQQELVLKLTWLKYTKVQSCTAHSQTWQRKFNNLYLPNLMAQNREMLGQQRYLNLLQLLYYQDSQKGSFKTGNIPPKQNYTICSFQHTLQNDSCIPVLAHKQSSNYSTYLHSQNHSYNPIHTS